MPWEQPVHCENVPQEIQHPPSTSSPPALARHHLEDLTLEEQANCYRGFIPPLPFFKYHFSNVIFLNTNTLSFYLNSGRGHEVPIDLKQHLHALPLERRWSFFSDDYFLSYWDALLTIGVEYYTQPHLEGTNHQSCCRSAHPS